LKQKFREKKEKRTNEKAVFLDFGFFGFIGIGWARSWSG
jgi:hypothetical protein